MGSTVQQVCFPETSTAWLLSNHPRLQVYCITVPTEGMRFALLWRLQTPFSPSTLQPNFFEVIRAQMAWEGAWGWEPVLLPAHCLAWPWPVIFSVPRFSHFLPTWCNYTKMVSTVLPVQSGTIAHQDDRNPFQNQINCFCLDTALTSVCEAAYQN